MDKKTKFIFSCPIFASSPLETEKLAFLFLFDKVKSLLSINSRLLLYTDSLTLVNQAQQVRAGYINLEGDEDWKEVIDSPFVKLYFMQREELLGVDELAKKRREEKFYPFFLDLIGQIGLG